MLIGDLSPRELSTRIRSDGVHLNTGAFTVHLSIDWEPLVPEFARIYARYPIEEPAGIDDARIRVRGPSWLERFARPMVRASSDGGLKIEPVPAERGFTALESCLNWGVVANGAAPIIMHAAAVEREGRAILMPAPSGSGKSTLCAAMSWRGWRLLSDEMAVFSFERVSVLPNPRPVSLKNAAIEVVKAFEPGATFTETYRGTLKGNVAYMRAPDDSVDRAGEPAVPAIVLVPKWSAGESARLEPMTRSAAFRWLVDSTINYPSMLGYGFDLITALVDRCDLLSLTYSDLDEAIALIARLSED